MAGEKRVDSASRIINAPPQVIYRGFLDADAFSSWLPPSGMSGRVEAFDPRPGGVFRVVLVYDDPDHAVAGKSSEHADIVAGRFVELVPDERIVWEVTFQSDDPAFAGVMTMTWSLMHVGEGTEVTVRAEDVPAGIRKEDHDEGLRSTLENLAAWAE